MVWHCCFNLQQRLRGASSMLILGAGMVQHQQEQAV